MTVPIKNHRPRRTTRNPTTRTGQPATGTRALTLLTLAILLLPGCGVQEQQAHNAKLEEVAGNEEVLNFMRTFDGRGILSDSSASTPPADALKTFRCPDNLALDLVLAEPDVTQPVYLYFDYKGRLWVVQYNQYPYPKGLKVMSMDHHIRAQFDKVPPPPPDGTRGADKITLFEDTNADGTFDKSTDVIEGLNIATSVALGRGKIWVLDPPYLLAYDDDDNDALPDGDPVVHLEGFGLEDTHAIANNLRWGPDGWLYGAQGSTCTANISSSVTKNVVFDGQVIWRYHPDSHIFEIFGEGGGNTFDVEFDAKGRLYSGDNGSSRGRYYKQGAYYYRNLGKHGAYTNPYAFGNLPEMKLEGERIRFTHAFIKYEEQNLPPEYHGKMIALNPLHSYVQLSSFEPNGSTFAVIDEQRLIQTDDRWFRPVDIMTGPDGAVYLADWYDSRLSHVDPRDTWSKNTGRVYRLRDSKQNATIQPFDISAYSDEKLIETLSYESKWFRQQALIEFGNRKNSALVPLLRDLMKSGDGQTALEALWAISLSGGFKDDVATDGLHHDDPFVRMWTVRLLGDANNVSNTIATELSQLALSEPHAEVRSQLAASAKRLPGPVAIPVITNLLKGHNDENDPDIPLQIWWALESKAVSNRDEILAMFNNAAIWNSPIVTQTIMGRLMQRWIMVGGDANYSACASLLEMAPTPEQAKPLINGIQEGLRGMDIAALPPDLASALEAIQSEYGSETLAVALRQGQPQAVKKVLEIIADADADVGAQLTYIRILGEVNVRESVPVLLRLMDSGQSSGAIKQAALEALSGYDDPDIGARVTKAYPDRLRADPLVRGAALSLLSQRNAWATQLLNAIDRKKQPGEKFIARTISKTDVTEPIARRLLLLDDPSITTRVNNLWPEVALASSAEKNERIEKIAAILKSGSGNALTGQGLFRNRCGSCHRLFNEGGTIGPDLTGYDRKNIGELLVNIIDPNTFIREGYETYHIVTTDGRSLLGSLKEQSGATVTIQPFSGELITLSKKQVKDMKAREISLMPEGLMNGLTDQEVRDLVAYLTR